MTNEEQQGNYPPPESGAEQAGAPAPEPPPNYQYAQPEQPQRKWARETTTAFDPRRKNVALACILSCMPGLGQIYVGYYQRAFVHILVVGSIIALLNARLPDPLIAFLGFFMAFFWLYNMVDAGRRAALYNQALRGSSPMKLPDELSMPGLGGSVLGGSILIGLGFLLLLHTRFDMTLDWVAEWWPLAPILFGAYLLYKGATRKSASSE